MELNIQNEKIRKFLEKVEQEPELQKKLSQIRDPEEAYKLATSIQEGFTKEEFVTEMKKLYEEMINELSEEDLEKVAGGMTGGEIASVATGSVVLASATVVGSALLTGSVSAAAGAAAF